MRFRPFGRLFVRTLGILRHSDDRSAPTGARQAADLLGGRYRGYPLSEYCSQSASMCFCCLRIKILISGARGKSGKVLEDM